MTRFSIMLGTAAAVVLSVGIISTGEPMQSYAASSTVHHLASGRLHSADLSGVFVDSGVHTSRTFNSVMTLTVGPLTHRCTAPATVTASQWRQGTIQVLTAQGGSGYVSVCGWLLRTSGQAGAAYAAVGGPIRDLVTQHTARQVSTPTVGDESATWKLLGTMGSGSYAVTFRHANAIFTLAIINTHTVSNAGAARLAARINGRLR